MPLITPSSLGMLEMAGSGRPEAICSPLFWNVRVSPSVKRIGTADALRLVKV